MDKERIELLIRDTTPNHKLLGLGLEHFKLPVTEALAASSVRLPTFPELRDDEVNKIIVAIYKFFGPMIKEKEEKKMSCRCECHQEAVSGCLNCKCWGEDY